MEYHFKLQQQQLWNLETTMNNKKDTLICFVREEFFIRSIFFSTKFKIKNRSLYGHVSTGVFITVIQHRDKSRQLIKSGCYDFNTGVQMGSIGEKEFKVFTFVGFPL
jgi:hypothetical protein